MGQNSAIEWTDTTWNPVTGCTKITRGCDNCYAERFAERFRGVPGHPFESGFDLTTRPERLHQPLAWKRPRRSSAKNASAADSSCDFVPAIAYIMSECSRSCKFSAPLYARPGGAAVIASAAAAARAAAASSDGTA